MIGNVRGICCGNNCMELLEQHFPETLVRVNELQLFIATNFKSAYLDWPTAPLDFEQHGPRFLKMDVSVTFISIIDAVRKVF